MTPRSLLTLAVLGAVLGGCATRAPQSASTPDSFAPRVVPGSRIAQPPDPATQSVTGEDLKRTGQIGNTAQALREVLPELR